MRIAELLAALLIVVLLVAAFVACVRLLVPALNMGKSRALKIAVVVFAVLGALTMSSAAAMLLMHLGMSLMGCCQQP